MAIAHADSGAGNGTETSGASLDLVCPATVNANDILIAQVIHTGTGTAPSTPANWSLLYGPVNIGTTPAGRHWVFGKLAAGTEDGATIGFGTAGGTEGRAGRIYRFTGWVSGTLADVVPAASFSNIEHATDPQGPSVTTTVVGALAIALTTQTDNNTEEAMTGMTGGTWGGFVTFVSTTLGPVGLHIDIEVATPTANPGTISGGAMVAANDPSSTIGFEIRPNAPLVATPGIATLTLTPFAATVTVTNNQLVTPGIATLTTTKFAPTILTPRLVTPSTVSLALSTFAPTVTVGVIVIPTTAALVSATFAPTVSTPRLVTPPQATLTIALFAPTVLTPRLVVPGVATVTLSTFAPSVSAGAGLTVTPPTAVLTLTTFAPTVLAPRLVTPAPASLTVSLFAPTVTTPRLVTPGIGSLTLSTFAPAVMTPRVVIPAFTAITTTRFAPTVSLTAHVTVIPGTASLTLITFPADVTLSGGITNTVELEVWMAPLRFVDASMVVTVTDDVEMAVTIEQGTEL